MKAQATQFSAPPAVISLILSHLYTHSPSFLHPLGEQGVGDLDLDIPSIQRYSLISREWKEQCQRLLFHNLDMGTMRRSPRLRAFLKSFPAATTAILPQTSDSSEAKEGERPPSPDATLIGHASSSHHGHGTLKERVNAYVTSRSLQTSPSGLALPTYVRILSLSIGHSYTTHIQATELADILSLFPFLYELRLSIEGNPPALPARALQQLEPNPSGGGTPPIEALRITLGPSLENPEILYQLLSVPWPIKFLSITQPNRLPVLPGQRHDDPKSIISKQVLDTLAPPTYKLLEYRTDAFPGWQALFEWVTLFAVQTINTLVVPPCPQSETLRLLAPQLQSLSLIYEPGVTQEVFEGMEDFPKMPELLELNLVNATLQKGSRIYQSIPMSVESFSMTLSARGRNNIRTILEICPTIPMRMEKVTVWAEPPNLASVRGTGHRGLMSGWESMVGEYRSMDGRLEVKKKIDDLPSMIPFTSIHTSRYDPWVSKRYMDRAVKDRPLPAPRTPPASAPQLLRRLLSTSGTRLGRALSLSRDKPGQGLSGIAGYRSRRQTVNTPAPAAAPVYT